MECWRPRGGQRDCNRQCVARRSILDGADSGYEVRTGGCWMHRREMVMGDGLERGRQREFQAGLWRKATRTGRQEGGYSQSMAKNPSLQGVGCLLGRVTSGWVVRVWMFL